MSPLESRIADTMDHEVGKIEAAPTDVETHRVLHSDPEKLEHTTTPEQPKRRQPYSAVWTVIACGFALMSDGMSPENLSNNRLSQFRRRYR